MKWSQPADPRVVEAVVAAFREPTDGLDAVLVPLSAAQWERSFYWLDASGMALYLIDRLQELNLLWTLPPAIRMRLQWNLADNRERSASMFREFTVLNRAFQAEGIDYCNLKGFSLPPESCPDLNLRTQLDFDFLVDGADIDRCRALVEQMGYVLRGATTIVWEFKTAGDELANIADLYKPKEQRCVEIHFAEQASRDDRLNRLQSMRRAGVDFPALSPAEQFVGQATHLLAHLCGTCTRLAWAIEFERHIKARFDDRIFWQEVRERVNADNDAVIAVGVACVVVQKLFGTVIPPLLTDGPVQRLPETIRLWTELYSIRAILADFPGTKLYLLLREQLRPNDPAFPKTRRALLLPPHMPARIIHVNRDAGYWKRLRGEWYQFRYRLFRLRFHAVQGLVYLVESHHWQRNLKINKRSGDAEDSRRQAEMRSQA